MESGVSIVAPLTWATVELDMTNPLNEVFAIMITFEAILLPEENIGFKDLFLEGCYTAFGESTRDLLLRGFAKLNILQNPIQS